MHESCVSRYLGKLVSTDELTGCVSCLTRRGSASSREAG